MANERIKVYGTSWCPDTARARQCLTRLNVPYDWCDIEKDKAGCNRQGIPMDEANGCVIPMGEKHFSG